MDRQIDLTLIKNEKNTLFQIYRYAKTRAPTQDSVNSVTLSGTDQDSGLAVQALAAPTTLTIRPQRPHLGTPQMLRLQVVIWIQAKPTKLTSQNPEILSRITVIRTMEEIRRDGADSVRLKLFRIRLLIRRMRNQLQMK